MPRPARWPPLAPTKDIGDYLFLRGAVSRWLWRIYVQRFTTAGRWFLLVSFIFIAYGGASLQLQAYVTAIYILAMWIIAVVALLGYRPRTRLMSSMPSRIRAGETLSIDVSVEQLGTLRGADLMLLAHRLPQDIDSVPPEGVPLPDLRRGEKADARVLLHCTHRGAYTLRGFRVESGFPFGILRTRQTFPQQHALLVYPAFTPLAQLILPMSRRYQPGGVAMTSQLGESFEYLGNREYREGDNPRDIDWRATARATRPIVREWVEEYMLRAAVILDTHVPASLRGNATQRRRDDFERGVSLCAAVSDYMARQDYLVDLFAAGPDLYHLTAGRSLAYLDQILDILACVEENSAEPFDAIEPHIAGLLERLSVVICVFLDWNSARREFVLRLRSANVALKVIIVSDHGCTLNPADDAGLLGEVPVITQEQFEAGISQL
jgi:uncharacterized protein (DUF58 family)